MTRRGTRAGTRRGTRGRTLLALLVAAGGSLSCFDLTVDPKAIGSIEFIAPTNPSIIVGDTLRDTTGAKEALRARVFAASGDEITDIVVTFVNSDSLVRIVGGNLVVTSKDTTGTARLFASAGGLQSGVRTLSIIPRPDSIAPSVAQDTVRYRLALSGTAIDTSTTAGVIVRSGAQLVSGVRVTFELLRGGVPLARSDTGTYALVGAQGRVSWVDTTDASGVAQRTLRLRTTAGTIIRDTVVVRANVSLGGAPLKGAPALVRLVILPAS